MSTTFYESPDDKWNLYEGGPSFYGRLSIDVTNRSVWFFGDSEDGSEDLIVLPLSELPAIAEAINAFLESTV